MEKKYKPAYIDRDLSWVKFNQRVAEESMDKTSPIFERLKFVSIYGSNMSEFYMVRIGSHQEELLHLAHGSKEHEKKQKLIDELKTSIEEADKFTADAYNDILADFSQLGFTIKKPAEWTMQEEKSTRDYFKNMIVPLLSPIILGKNDSFPHMTNGTIYLVAEFIKGEKQLFGICELPQSAPKIYVENAHNGKNIFLIEDMLLKFSDKVFDGMKLKRSAVISLNRNADIDIDETVGGANDYRKMLSFLIDMRTKLFPVRMLFKGQFKGSLEDFILKRTKFVGNHIFDCQLPLSFGFIGAIKDFTHLSGVISKSTMPQLEKANFSPKTLASHKNASMIALSKNADQLFSYPFLSFKPLVKFLEQCADDPKVTEIKMTLYRVNNNSKIIDALISASEQGKKVTVIIELKARFDEKHNIEISRQLQHAGCIVSFGQTYYKVHSKLIAVKFSDGSHLTYVGTGNFNEITAKLYTDLGIITSSKEIGQDAFKFFEQIIECKQVDYNKLWTTPDNFKSQFIQYIDEEIQRCKQKKKGLIVIKCNALTHPEIIEKLFEASSYGVKIQLIIRGACSIIPKVLGLSDNITLRSIVGDFLEHSRIYSFGIGSRRKVIIGSCDLMSRNLDKRFEAGILVEDKAIKSKLVKMLNIYLKDNVNARECDANGEYRFVQRLEGEKEVNSQG